MYKFLKTLDRRWIYLFIALSVIIPIATGVKFTVVSSPMTDDFHALLKDVAPGSKVLISADFDPGSQAELQPMLTAFLKYCFDNQIKVVTMGLWPLGPDMVAGSLKSDRIYLEKEEAMQRIAEGKEVFLISAVKSSSEQKVEKRGDKFLIIQEDKDDKECDLFTDQDKFYVKGLLSLYDLEYGVDYLQIGYKVGGPAAIRSITSDFKKGAKSDAKGAPVEKFEITRGINDLKDFELLFNISAGTPGIKEWVVHGTSKYSFPILSGVTAVSAPEFFPYVASGQIKGLLAGLAGAAELEVVTGYYEGSAVKGMAAQSYAHLVIIIFIIIGNLVYLYEKFFLEK